jgi:hypothetical protein
MLLMEIIANRAKLLMTREKYQTKIYRNAPVKKMLFKVIRLE